MVQKQELQCQNVKCRYVWPYFGKSLNYTTCPRCRYKVPVNAQKQKTMARFKELLDRFEGNIKKKRYSREDIEKMWDKDGGANTTQIQDKDKKTDLTMDKKALNTEVKRIIK